MLARAAKLTRPGLVTLMIMALLIGVPAAAKPRPAPEARPVAAPPAAPGVVDTETFNLCASAGTITLPGPATASIWGFSLDTDPGPGVVCDPAQLPGPVLTVDAGDTVIVNLANNLTQNVSIVFPGQSLIPDSVGAGPGGTVSYTFTAANPGTYLYETGTNTGAQVPMGLYGALIVRPLTPNQAYNSAASAYNAEAILVLSELDPVLNAAIAGGTFGTGTPCANPPDLPADPPGCTPSLLSYAPKYWLINGNAYPATVAISAPVGGRLLLRYLNAGSIHHTMSLLGAYQRVIARDAYPLNHPFDAVAETIPAGQTADLIATIPPGAVVGSTLPLYNRQLHVTNGAGTFPGGMLTFVTVAAATLPTATPVPPSPTPTNTPTPTPVPPAVTLYLSLENSGSYTVGSVSGVTDEDILSFGSGNFAMFFDGSDVGVGGLNLDAFAIVNPTTILMSFDLDATIGSLGLVDDSDVVQFTATSLGANTVGTFSMYFDGSDVGLTLSTEDVDAIELRPTGLLISTVGDPTVSGPALSPTPRDEDLLQCAGSFGPTTTCTWSYYFDGSDKGLDTTSDEDVDAVAVVAAGNSIRLSTIGNFIVSGSPSLSGADEDVFSCGPPLTTGAGTSCTNVATLFFDGSAFGLSGNDVDAIELP